MIEIGEDKWCSARSSSGGPVGQLGSMQRSGDGA
jgi:hypothetical protein